MKPAASNNKEVARYTCYKINQSIQIDGDLNKPVWQKAIHSPRFVDMITGVPGFYNTDIV